MACSGGDVMHRSENKKNHYFALTAIQHIRMYAYCMKMCQTGKILTVQTKQNQEDNICCVHFQDKRKNREHKTNAQLTQIKPDFAF